MAIIHFPTQMSSTCIWCNDEVIVSATPTITGSGAGSVDIYLGVCDTIDGAYTWEGPIQSGTEHTFADTGKKFIAWKLIGVDYIVTNFEVVINP